MDRHAIAGAIVMPFASPGFDAAIELDTLVRCARGRDRVKPMPCYDPGSGKAGLASLLRLLESADIAGVKFFTGYDAYGPLDESIAAILD
ncbi:MAG: hypothetical protein GF344_06655, partial [Chitinivibrionales bacterium]|nr:hypothetical protein [Chitinivibrionales bacterium]